MKARRLGYRYVERGTGTIIADVDDVLTKADVRALESRADVMRIPGPGTVEEQIARIKTARLLIDAATDLLCGTAGHGFFGWTVLHDSLRQITGAGVPGTGTLGAWIAFLEGVT